MLLVSAILLATIALEADEMPKYRIMKNSDRVFYNTNMPLVKVKAYSSNYMPSAVELKCLVKESVSDSLVFSFTQNFKIETEDSAAISFAFNLSPGFYKVELSHKGSLLNKCTIGYEPEKIEFQPEKNDTLLSYIGKCSDELISVPLNAAVTKVKKLSGKLRNVYRIKMDGADGGFVDGYYAVPKKKGLYSAVVTFCSKDSIIPPVADEADSLIHLNIAPDKSVADLLRAVDFLQTRPEVSLADVVSYGEGVGAAYALAAAAIDKRIWRSAVYAPAVEDFKHKELSSISDLVQLVEKIESQVLFGLNIDDEKSTAYNNFAVYNNIRSEKEYYIFVEEKNPLLWKKIVEHFYEKHRK